MRQSLRWALDRICRMEADVLAADSRWPARALPAVKRLQAQSTRVAALTAELEIAVRREIDGQRWLKGKPPYVE